MHPFFIAAYPVIALLAHNIEEVKPVVALRALVLSITASLLLYSLLKRFSEMRRNRRYSPR